MDNIIIQYSFSELNENTLIFVPGYTGGLDVSVIKELVNYFLQHGGYNLFGLNIDYRSDTTEGFQKSQNNLVKAIHEISYKVKNSSIIVLGKSLGGSLTIFNVNGLPVSKAIVLGCPVVLGWPQRVSLLKVENPLIPDYKTEWGVTLSKISTPTLILSGDCDDLSDNNYLTIAAENNVFLDFVSISHANHDLEDIANHQLLKDCVLKSINSFLVKSLLH